MNIIDTGKIPFWNRVKKTKKCWVWSGSIMMSGYGRININNKHYYAHRLSFEIHNGAVPKGLYVCHKCDNKKCIRPSHLFLGTPLDNMIDKTKKGRQAHNVGEFAGGAKLTNKDVEEIKSSYQRRIITQEMLSKKFKVSRRHIGNILQAKRWKHL